MNASDVIAERVDDWMVQHGMPRLERMFAHQFGSDWESHPELVQAMADIVDGWREFMYERLRESVAAEFGCDGALRSVGTRH